MNEPVNGYSFPSFPVDLSRHFLDAIFGICLVWIFYGQHYTSAVGQLFRAHVVRYNTSSPVCNILARQIRRGTQLLHPLASRTRLLFLSLLLQISFISTNDPTSNHPLSPTVAIDKFFSLSSCNVSHASATSN